MMKKDYHLYRLEDFSSDEEFKRWVLNPDPGLDYYWNKVMESFPEKRPEMMQARELLLLLKFDRISKNEAEEEESLNKILQNKKSKGFFESIEDSRFTRSSRSMNRYAAAATFLILMLSSLYLWQYVNENEELGNSPLTVKSVVKTNPAGQKLNFVFPDGSKATLNAESSINFPEQFSDSVRMVELTGEAYFDIVKDGRPFLVKTGNIITRVLGTSFNVNAYPENEQVTVALVEGKVQVFTGLDESTILEPTEKLEIDRHTLVTYKSNFDPLVEAGWKDGVLVFNGDDLNSVISKLERWYGVYIRLDNKPHREWQLRGKFRNLSLEQLLDNLEFTNKINYDINGNQVTLRF